MNTTKIEWADTTINPVVGCSHCSPGCDNCYAERFAARLSNNSKTAPLYTGVVDKKGCWTGKFRFIGDECEDDVSAMAALDQWFGRRIPKQPCRIFLGSMTDLFHEQGAKYKLLEYIFMRLYEFPKHTFVVLTKRPERMRSFMLHFQDKFQETPIPNLWLGVTVCNQAEADAKIPLLLQTPAAKRFVSVEPMLGPVEIGKYLYGSYECGLSCGTRLPCTDPPDRRCAKCGFVGPDDYETWGDGDCEECPQCHQDGCCGAIEEICPNCGHYMVQYHPDTPVLDWVICGGETGPGARPMHPDWARSLRDQCQSSGTPYFFKSWGEWTANYTYDQAISTPGAYMDDTPFARVGKRRAGRLLDGREWNEFPEVKNERI